MAEHSAEVSVANAHCVVYELVKNTEWKVTGEGWAQIHLYRDESDGTFRIVGWTVKNLQVVINCNVTSICVYKKKSPDFHKFIDEENKTYGFGFYKKEESYEESEKFMDAVMKAIGQSAPPPGPGPASTATGPATGGVPQDEMKSSSSSKSGQGFMARMASGAGQMFDSVYQNAMIPLGKLKILAPKEGRQVNVSGPVNVKKGQGVQIGDAYDIKHDTHVKYDKSTKKFQGLPQEWQQYLNKSFGVPVKQVKAEKVPGYEAEIPSVLIVMKDYLLKNSGADTLGIFRLAPDASECDFIKKKLDDATFKDSESCDVNCMSNLIKVWFRDLPINILESIDKNLITACDNETSAAEIVQRLEQPSRSIFEWLLDLCVIISDNQKVNKMSEQNMAVVIAPNLFEPSTEDPLASLMFSQKVANFLHKAILHRRSVSNNK